MDWLTLDGNIHVVSGDDVHFFKFKLFIDGLLQHWFYTSRLFYNIFAQFNFSQILFNLQIYMNSM